jgi:hypothetical protein
MTAITATHYNAVELPVVIPPLIAVSELNLPFSDQMLPSALMACIEAMRRTWLLFCESNSSSFLSYATLPSAKGEPGDIKSSGSLHMCAGHGTVLAGESPATGIYRQV